MATHLQQIVRRVLLEDISKRTVGSSITVGTSAESDESESAEDVEMYDVDPTVVDVSNSAAAGAYTPVTGNTKAVNDFIKALIPAYAEEFERPLVVGSTFRSMRSQAAAMRYPLESGDFDALYRGALGDDFEEVKDLISTKKYDAATVILNTKKAMQRSHVVGKAVDFSFNKNKLAPEDHTQFRNLVTAVSKASGISASVNPEKATHFHVDVSGARTTPAPTVAKAVAPAAAAAAPAVAAREAISPVFDRRQPVMESANKYRNLDETKPTNQNFTTSASTSIGSSKYPTQRFDVYGGMDASGSGPAGFQLSSVLIGDSHDNSRKSYSVGDYLPDGSAVQDIQRRGMGEMAVSVVLPDGREAWLGRRPRPPKPDPKEAEARMFDDVINYEDIVKYPVDERDYSEAVKQQNAAIAEADEFFEAEYGMSYEEAADAREWSQAQEHVDFDVASKERVKGGWRVTDKNGREYYVSTGGISSYDE